MRPERWLVKYAAVALAMTVAGIAVGATVARSARPAVIAPPDSYLRCDDATDGDLTVVLDTILAPQRTHFRFTVYSGDTPLTELDEFQGATGHLVLEQAGDQIAHVHSADLRFTTGAIQEPVQGTLHALHRGRKIESRFDLDPIFRSCNPRPTDPSTHPPSKVDEPSVGGFPLRESAPGKVPAVQLEGTTR
jgi:hypothetical protein